MTENYKASDGYTRRDFVKTALLIGELAGLTGLFAACASTSKPKVQLMPGMPNTLTFTNNKGEKETIYNIEGKWSYSSPSIASGAIVEIIQKDEKVDGYWKANSGYCREGSVWFEGSIKDNTVAGTRYLCTSGKDKLYIKILEDGNRLLVDILVDGKPATGELKKIQ